MDWLISNNFAVNRLEAVTLASMLMEENFLRPVGARSMGAIRSGDLAEQFLDDSTALYTFVSYGACSSCHQGRGKEDRGSTVMGERPRVQGTALLQLVWVSVLRILFSPGVAPIAWTWEFLLQIPALSFPLRRLRATRRRQVPRKK